MFEFLNRVILVLLISVTLGTAVCASDQIEQAIIVGSAESPDPILERVKQLEAQGLLQGVIVMESFPVQIHLKGTKALIDELQNMPRVVSPHFH